MRNKLYILFCTLIACFLIFSVAQKELLLKSDNVFYLKLAPVDPRSLMQGDYMVLEYDVNRALPWDFEGADKVVLSKNYEDVASYAGLYKGQELADNEIAVNLIKLKSGMFTGGWLASVAPVSFMFQEGHAERYEAASYAILKADKSGKVLLTGLADRNLAEIK